MITVTGLLGVFCAYFAYMWICSERDVDMYHHAIENARMRGLRIPSVIEIVDEEIYPVHDALVGEQQ